MTADVLTTTRELDSRLSDGKQIRLLWCEHDGRLWVTVLDPRTGEAFRIEVRRGERPLDVFHHPYAYAADHGVQTSTLRAADISVSMPA
ncbi:MAG TPA: hypothetical protein VEF89_00535 [Solirubrobacteraceae bacterium]|nr:hypothetical protein [Solirubrobacteraceae bacterium]